MVRQETCTTSSSRTAYVKSLSYKTPRHRKHKRWYPVTMTFHSHNSLYSSEGSSNDVDIEPIKFETFRDREFWLHRIYLYNRGATGQCRCWPFMALQWFYKVQQAVFAKQKEIQQLILRMPLARRLLHLPARGTTVERHCKQKKGYWPLCFWQNRHTTVSPKHCTYEREEEGEIKRSSKNRSI